LASDSDPVKSVGLFPIHIGNIALESIGRFHRGGIQGGSSRQVESKIGLDDTEFNAATAGTSCTTVNGGTFIIALDFSINFRQRPPPGGIIQGVLLYTMTPCKTPKKTMGEWDYHTKIIPLLSSMKPGL
jgi:hypothetical protein